MLFAFDALLFVCAAFILQHAFPNGGKSCSLQSLRGMVRAGQSIALCGLVVRVSARSMIVEVEQAGAVLVLRVTVLEFDRCLRGLLRRRK